MSILTLAPDRVTRFIAVGTSLGFSAAEAHYLATKRPLSEAELVRARNALEESFFNLVHAEVAGRA